MTEKVVKILKDLLLKIFTIFASFCQLNTMKFHSLIVFVLFQHILGVHCALNKIKTNEISFKKNFEERCTKLLKLNDWKKL